MKDMICKKLVYQIKLTYRLDGGEVTMKYDDDQCERCGGIRVAGSTLCVDCLVVRCKNQSIKFGRVKMENRELVEKIKKLTELCKRLLDHITSDMIIDSEPYDRIRKSIGESMKGDWYEKNSET